MGFLHQWGRVTGIAAAIAAGFAATASHAATSTNFTINELTGRDTFGNPLPYWNHPSMKRGPDGNFIVSWAAAITATSPVTVYSQVFAADGSPLGTPFQITVGTTSYWTPALAVSKTGDSAAAWQQFDAQYKTHVMIQRFDPTGNPKGAVIDAGIEDIYSLGLFNSAFFAESTPPKIAMDDAGNLIVGWSTSKEYHYEVSGLGWLKGYGSGKTWLAEYAPDGTVLKAAFAADKTASASLGPCTPLASCPSNANMLQDLEVDGAGNLVLMLTAQRPDGSITGAVRYYKAGFKAAGGLRTYPDISGAYSFQALGIDAAGNYTIEWYLPTGMSLARYSSDGTQLGSTLGPLADPDGSSSYWPFSEQSNGDLALPLCSYVPYVSSGSLQGYPNYSCTVQYYNPDLTVHGAPVVVPNNSADLNNRDLTFGLADDGSLITTWSAVLGSNSDNAILGALTRAP